MDTEERNGNQRARWVGAKLLVLNSESNQSSSLINFPCGGGGGLEDGGWGLGGQMVEGGVDVKL